MISKNTSNNKTIIWAAIITGIFSLLVALIQWHPWDGKKNDYSENKEYIFSGTIVNENNNEGIALAEISIVGRNEQYYTEQNGNFSIKFEDSVDHIRVRVSKSQYLIYDKTFDIPSKDVMIQLIPKKK